MAWAALVSSGCGSDETVGKDAGSDVVPVADAQSDTASPPDTADKDIGPDVGADIIGPGKPCKVLGDCGDPEGPCRGWVCHSELGCVAVLAPQDAACTPTDSCFTSGRCLGDTCQPEAPKDCDDGETCTADGCEDGACVHLPISASQNVACDDGDACTLDDHCDEGCKAGANVCFCQSDADCADKNGGDLCKGSWYCGLEKDGAKVCKLNPATVVQCDPSANTACRQNVCASGTGLCGLVDVADGKACSDGDKCTAGETCQSGACTGGTAVCCQSDADCAAKDDGDLCNGTFFCNQAQGVCQFNPATVVSCSTVDDSACLHNTCDPKKGTCAPVATPDGTLCDDGNPCTPGQEVCAKGACKAATNTCSCSSDADCAGKDDGNLCNGTLYCAPATGVCEPNPATAILCPNVDDTACLKNQCQPKSGTCVLTPVADGVACDADGTVCTPTDTCKAGACVADSDNTCICQTTEECAKHDDGDLCNGSLFCDLETKHCKLNAATVVSCPSAENTACAKSLCQPSTGQCSLTFVNQGLVCDDGDPCSKGDVCDNGTCKSGGDICLCHQDADCKGQEDGNVCNGTLFCDKATVPWSCTVKPSTVITCPTVNDTECQVSVCQPLSGLCKIQVQNVDEPCDDGDPCTLGTLCKGGVCINPNVDAQKPCDDANPCTDDSCDPKLGCVNVANKAPCDDGDACTESDACAGKLCASGKPKVCDDSNPCTTDVCNQQAGCVVFFNADPCSDGSACTVGDGCKAGACVPGVAKVCDDGKPCTLDGCNAATGACVFDGKVAAAVVCDDGVACTVDTCDPLLGCKHLEGDSNCDDKIACTVDACSAISGCVHTNQDALCEDGDACSFDRCLAGTGCAHDPNPDGTLCFDADPCTVGDACKAGKCVAGPKSASCNVGADICKGKADGTACNDGDACTKGEDCRSGLCVAKVLDVSVVAWLGSKAVDKHLNGHRLQAETRAPTSVALGADGAMLFGSDQSPMLRRVGLNDRVTTIAGTGVEGSNDGKAVGAQLRHPCGLLPRADGSVIIVDTARNQVVLLDKNGQLSTVAGSGTGGYVEGGASNARFNLPCGVAQGPGDSVLVADTNNNCIRKVDLAAKTVSSFTGKCVSGGSTDGAATSARFQRPVGIVSLPSGGWVVSDRDNNRLRRVAVDGSVSTLAGGTKGMLDATGAAARFATPLGLAATNDGAVLVADSGNHRIRRVVLATGVVTTFLGGALGDQDGAAGQATFNTPSALAFDAFGDLVVADTANKRLRKVIFRRHACDDGKPCTIDQCNSQSGACSVLPTSVCEDGNPCTAAICDAATGACSYKAEPDGVPCDDGEPCTVGNVCGSGSCWSGAKLVLASKSSYGEADGPIGAFQVFLPEAIEAHPDGGVVIADSNHLVRRLRPDGTVVTIAGAPWLGAGYLDGPSSVARFNAPAGLAVRADRTILVAEVGNDRIRAISPAGKVTTVAGQGTQGYVDGPAGVARFADPRDIVIGPVGDLIIADTVNHRLRRLHAGTVSTFSGGGSGWVDGPSDVARFYHPEGLAYGSDGMLYVAESSNHALRRVAADGSVETLFRGDAFGQADGGMWEGQINAPRGIAVDSDGTVYLGTADRIRSWTPTAGLRTIVGGPTKGFVPGFGPTASVQVVVGLTITADGKLWISDRTAHAIGWLELPRPDCDDGNACTVDRCIAGKGCVSKAAALPCDDGNPCTAGDACASGSCKAGAAVSGCVCKAGGCDDANPCTDDHCDPKAGCKHVSREEGTPCEDGNACSGTSACEGGVCAANGPEGASRPETRRGAEKVGAGTIDGSVVVAGGGVGSATHLDPRGLARAADGTIYWVESGQHALRSLGKDGVVRTHAGGTGTTGYGLVDGHALAARLYSPRDCAIDATGALWIADTNNHAIRRYDPETAALTTFAGAVPTATAGFVDGKGKAARFDQPHGVDAAPGGTILVADSANHALRQISADGTVVTLLGNNELGHVDGPVNIARLNYPTAVEAGQDGTIWIADTGNHSLRRFTGGVLLTVVGMGGAAAKSRDGFGVIGGGFDEPAGLAVDDANGRVYVTERAGRRLRVWQEGFGLRTVLGTGESGSVEGVGNKATLSRPNDVLLLPDGDLLVSELDGQRLRRVHPVGAGCDDANPCTVDVCDAKVGCKHTPAPAELACPDGGPCQVPSCDSENKRCTYAARPDGALCGDTTDCASQCLRGSCRKAAMLLHESGKDGFNPVDGKADEVVLRGPTRGLLEKDGAVTFVDDESHRVRRLMTNGDVVTLAGGGYGYAEGKGTVARFNRPMGIVRLDDGSYVIADRNNNRLRKMAPDTTVATLAGDGAAAHKDGVALTARFASPEDVVADTKGGVYVADTGNHVLRYLDADTKVTTFVGEPGKSGIQDGPVGVGRLSAPAALARDAKGNLYVADRGSDTIRRVTPQGHIDSIAGETNPYAGGYYDGLGPLGAGMSNPTGLALLPDGSLLVGDTFSHTIRHVVPGERVDSIVGMPEKTGNIEGFGHEARVGVISGFVLLPDGSALAFDTGQHRIWRLRTDLTSCKALAGASASSPASSCAAIGKQKSIAMLGHAWIDPNGGAPDDAYLSSCDHSTAGGGWTRFSESWTAADVNKLLGGKGQVLRRCGGSSLSYVASPVTSTPWSWAKKVAVAGTWTADGKAVACGADASFSTLPCGSGWGCADPPGAGAPSLLSGMTATNACATPSAAATTGPLSVCGKDNWATWELYGRAAP